MKFIAIVGTNASFSYNRKLLWYMKKHFINEAEIEVIEIAGLPLFSEDSMDLPDRIREIAEAIEAANGLIISTPEYDHAITAALKSLLEWLSWGALQPIINTPVMIVGASLGKQGSVFAQENLRQILQSPGLEAFVLPANQFLLSHAADAFDVSGNLIDRQTISWLEHCFRNFCRYSENLQPLRALIETDADTGASEYE